MVKKFMNNIVESMTGDVLNLASDDFIGSAGEKICLVSGSKKNAWGIVNIWPDKISLQKVDLITVILHFEKLY